MKYHVHRNFLDRRCFRGIDDTHEGECRWTMLPPPDEWPLTDDEVDWEGGYSPSLYKAKPRRKPRPVRE